ncbi:MAG: hypothetical protein EB067_07180 [Actinobacteria bacterium]|nr:hypothetical protein [Actinomycetota bacterium]
MNSTRFDSFGVKILIFSLLVSSLSVVSQFSANALEQTFNCPGGGTYTVIDGVLTWRQVNDYPTSAFSTDCAGDVILDDSVVQIGVADSAQLTVYDGVTSITIPATTTSILGGIPFAFNSSSFSGINVDPANSSYKSVAGVLFSKDGTELIQYPGLPQTSYNIPEGVIQINENAFRYSGPLQEIYIPSSATSVPGQSLKAIPSLNSIVVANDNSEYSSLNGVLYNKDQSILLRYPRGKEDLSFTVPSSVRTIEYEAVSSVHYLESVIFQEGLERINAFSFNYNYNMRTISQIPSSVTLIEFQSFLSSPISAINVNVNNSNYKSIDGVLFNKSGTQLIEYPDGKSGSYEIPEGVEIIAVYALWAANILRLVVPESVTRLDLYASSIRFIRFTGNSQITSLGHGSYSGETKSISYCGTPNSSISNYATTQNIPLRCQTAAPSFSLSSQGETTTAGTPLRGFAITSTVPADYYELTPSLGDLGVSGVNFDPTTGLISGTSYTPTAGTVLFSLTGSNAIGEFTVTYSLSISGSVTLIYAVGFDSETQTVTGQVRTPLRAQILFYGEVPPETSTVTSGALPAGLTLSQSGFISGTPTVAGSSTISFEVGYQGETATATAQFDISPASTPTLPTYEAVKDLPQTSSITSITQGCPADAKTVLINGSFLAPISNISIDNKMIDRSLWKQSSTQVVISVANPGPSPLAIQIYNGQVPVLAAQSITLSAICSTPTPTPTSL